MSRAESVAAFTDLYFPTVNGVTSTVSLWRERWPACADRDRMSVVYPSADDYAPDDGEYPVRSVRAPLYPHYRLGLPTTPGDVDPERIDLVHLHTPFTLGVAGLRFARGHDLPVVASYHTLLEDRAYQHVPDRFVEGLQVTCRTYERAFFERVDRVVAPTAFARDHLVECVEADVDAQVVSNGIDTGFFRPVDPADFRRRYDLPEGPIVGYTGRHGEEKNLEEAIDAVDGTDLALAFGGDGPTRESLEATACGTPVVAVDEGALTDSVIWGETGYRYPLGDVEAFRGAIFRVLAERDRLSDLCVRRRGMLSVEHSLEQLAGIYDELV